MELLTTDEDAATDKFGLPKMNTNTEVAISFTLTILGFLLILVTSFVVYRNTQQDISPIILGLLLVLSGYFFLMESVRELEQKDHFLSKRLMNKEEGQEEGSEE